MVLNWNILRNNDFDVPQASKSKKGHKQSVKETGRAAPVDRGLAQEILNELTPMLMTVIAEAVSSAVNNEVESVRKHLATAQYARQHVLLLRYENDKLEQYGRKN